MATHPVDPHASATTASRLFDLIRGYIGSELLCVAAELNLADLIRDGLRTSPELATRTGADPSVLHRILLGLVFLGVCTHDDATTFSLTPMGEFLTSDHPLGYHNVAIIHHEVMRPSIGQMLHSVKTGEVGIERALGSSLFGYLSEHPDLGARFDRFMGTVSAQTANALFTGYDLSSATQVIDVGGGQGTLVAAILKAHPNATGIVFDLPHVIERTTTYLDANGVRDRCEVVGGDFFASVPSGGDVYLLSQILHDWDDDACWTILSVIRHAMARDGRLLVLERVLPERVREGEPAVLPDLLMLAQTGGRERTEPEYRRLLDATGYGQVRVIATDSPFSIIEAHSDA